MTTSSPICQLAAGGQVRLAEIQIDDEIVAGKANRILVAGDLPQEADIHQRNLAAGVGAAVFQ